MKFIKTIPDKEEIDYLNQFNIGQDISEKLVASDRKTFLFYIGGTGSKMESDPMLFGFIADDVYMQVEAFREKVKSGNHCRLNWEISGFFTPCTLTRDFDELHNMIETALLGTNGYFDNENITETTFGYIEI